MWLIIVAPLALFWFLRTVIPLKDALLGFRKWSVENWTLNVNYHFTWRMKKENDGFQSRKKLVFLLTQIEFFTAEIACQKVSSSFDLIIRLTVGAKMLAFMKKQKILELPFRESCCNHVAPLRRLYSCTRGGFVKGQSWKNGGDGLSQWLKRTRDRARARPRSQLWVERRSSSKKAASRSKNGIRNCLPSTLLCISYEQLILLTSGRSFRDVFSVFRGRVKRGLGKNVAQVTSCAAEKLVTTVEGATLSFSCGNDAWLI